MSSAQANAQAAPSNGQQTMPGGPNGPQAIPAGLPSELANMPPEQLAALIQDLPNMLKNLADQDGENAKEAARTLSNLAAAAAPFGALPGGAGAHHLPPGGPAGLPFPPPGGMHGLLPPGLEPGPSTHPRGPPNLGQLSAAASGAMPLASAPGDGGRDDGGSDGEDGNGGDGEGGDSGPSATPGGGRRSGRSATMSNDEWTRQRKDNHKEVERRRRGNINEGINELGRIVPNGTGEKAKGAILQRAVQYIHHLKENEARNIEKWTLEKLLMDQAMGDLQAQLEEMRRLWEEERNARVRAEGELEVLRGVTGQAAPGQMAGADSNGKRRSREPDTAEGDEKDGKRQKVE